MMARTGRRRESRALFDYARSRRRDDKLIALVSDEGSPLTRVAEELRVQRCFSPPPLPHAYGALSLYGAVPAALLGYDLEELVGRAMEADRHDAVSLGVDLAEGVLGGAPLAALTGPAADAPLRDYLAGLLDATLPHGGLGPAALPLGEQPVPLSAQPYPVALGQPHEVGAHLYRWQVASAIAAQLLGSDPYAGPGDEEVEGTVHALLADLPVPDAPGVEPGSLGTFLGEHLTDGTLLRLESYLPEEAATELAPVVRALGDRFPGAGVRGASGPASSFAGARLTREGPRQLLVQLVAREQQLELTVPRELYGFGALTRARLLADGRFAAAAGRETLRIALDAVGELL
ncbi:MAG TPA: hypothetical protein VNF07_09840 [Acidimicrobiales bacterium]|nr:hypothetical protein [Acidimicrobiales bacterium]